ncbi:prefoldin subunit alpha [Candidatus Woesearchaeota archaeon]|nr:prefoldin subunit alpha [Candidatus Woesearchaeota archaeon]
MKQDEKELQEKYMEMKMAEEQIKEMQKQVQLVEQQLIELMSTIQSLEEFKKTGSGTEILVPLSPGIFAKAELKNNREFLVNVGSNVVVVKDIESTKKLMEKQVEETKALHTRVASQMQHISMYASGLEKELRELISKSK